MPSYGLFGDICCDYPRRRRTTRSYTLFISGSASPVPVAASSPTSSIEDIAEWKVRRKQLTDDGNVEIRGRDLREREIQARHPRPIGYRRAAS
jgi:hypothetical protein